MPVVPTTPATILNRTKTAGETITVTGGVPMAVSLDTTGNIIASNTSAYNRSNFL